MLILWLFCIINLFIFRRLFHGGTKTNIILVLPPRSVVAQHTVQRSPQWCKTRAETFRFCFSLRCHTHTTNEYTRCLACFIFFFRQPREMVKTLDLQWRKVRDGECVKETMVVKESTDFNSQNSSGRPPGMEGWGERERGKKGCQQVLLSLSQEGVRSKPSLHPSLHTHTHTGAYSHTHRDAAMYTGVVERLTHATVTLPAYTLAHGCSDSGEKPRRDHAAFRPDAAFSLRYSLYLIATET